jgi:uncharacterized delta-60 repeat protein
MMYRLSSSRALALVLTLAGAPAVLAAPGDLDPTFNGTGTVVTPIVSTDAEATAVVRQTDGKLVAAGFARVPVVGNPDNLDFAVVRYDESGTPDPSFGGTGIVTTAIRPGDDQAQAVIQQTDGKLVVAGLSYDGTSFNDSTITIVRYLDNGTPDPAFGGGTGKVTTAVGPDFDAALALIQQTDLKLVVAGYSGSDLALVRYETDGSLDMGFNGTGKVTTTVGAIQTVAKAILQQASDDKLVVAGSADGKVLLARYGTTGTLDGTFDGGTVTATVGTDVAEARAIVQQASDGKLVVAGVSANASNTDFMLLRYGLDGMPDGTFGTAGVVTTPVGTGDDAAFALAEQDDGALVAAGSSHNGTNLDFALVRYDTGGTPDATFGSGGKVITPIGTGNDAAAALLIQPNGGIVAAGRALSGGSVGFALARYLSLSGTTTSTSTVTTTSSTTVTTSSSTTVLPTTTTSSTVTTTSLAGTTSTTTFGVTTTTSTTLGGATTTIVGGSSTTTTFPGSTTTTLPVLVPGGPATKTNNDCYLELRVRGVVPAAVQKNQIVHCLDGASCDQGPAGDGRCEVEISACASQTDPALPDCTPPASLESVKVGGALAGSTSGLRAGPACSAPVRVQVPIKLSRSGKYLAGKSKVVIKGNARAPKGVAPRKDTDKWTIQCVPLGLGGSDDEDAGH